MLNAICNVVKPLQKMLAEKDEIMKIKECIILQKCDKCDEERK